MNNRLAIKDIQFGKTDAFNELNEYGPTWFMQSFFEYADYKMDSFVNGHSYFICGDKGIGKTALLRYLQCKLSENCENLIIPIRFKSDFDDEDKKSLLQASINVKEETIEGWEVVSTDDDAVLIWEVFIINKLLKSIDSGEYSVFKSNKELSNLLKLLEIVFSDIKNKLVPKLNRGMFSISASTMKGIDAQLEIEFGVDRKSNTVNFNKIAKSIIAQFHNLDYMTSSVYIMIDELELSIRSKKQYAKDVRLVRDLILAVYKINEICKHRQYKIRTIASIRNEVLSNVDLAGYEINKCIEDFGVKITWYQKGGDYRTSNLLKIVENKIIASEKNSGIKEHGDIWTKYFPETINGLDTRKYILNYTWIRPRDIVRLLTHVQNKAGDAYLFTQEMFDRALQDYSSASWIEITEELRLRYTATDDIKAIKVILTNIEVPFTYMYLNQRIAELSQIYKYVDEFYKKYNLIDVLEDLFDWGVIGNSGQRMIFKFLGDRTLAPTEDMIIHKPLRNFFGVKSREVRFRNANIYEESE